MTTFSTTGLRFGGRSKNSRFDATEADLHFYRDLSHRLHAHPNSHMLSNVSGPEAQHLVFIGESGPGDWKRFQQTVAARWPDLPTTGDVASDGARLESLPERIFYEHIELVRPRDIALDLHQPICPEHGAQRADMTLRLNQTAAYIEIIGACGSALVTRNENEARWLEKLRARLLFYKACGITPSCVFLDTLVQPEALRQLCLNLIATVRLTEARS
jgi:hypothetical protein